VLDGFGNVFVKNGLSRNDHRFEEIDVVLRAQNFCDNTPVKRFRVPSPVVTFPRAGEKPLRASGIAIAPRREESRAAAIGGEIAGLAPFTSLNVSSFGKVSFR
jgi:hypothetical protein